MIYEFKLLLLISFTVILGFISSLIYGKTKIPDIIWLLIFGLILGPITHTYSPELYIKLSTIMSIIALCIILFDAGINIDIKFLAESFPKSILLIATTYPLTVIIIGLTLTLICPEKFDLLKGLLLGGMIGGTSTVSTLGILGSFRGKESILGRVKNTLLLESILTDPIGIIFCITIIKLIILSKISFFTVLENLFILFTSSILLGYAFGFLWAMILDKLSGRPLTYIITLAVTFLVYIFSEEFLGEGSGALAVFMYSLAIANFQYILGITGTKRRIKIDLAQLRNFHMEITFLIKSFFFVYIGLIASISFNQVFIGILVVILILIVRFFSALITSKIFGFNKFERLIMQSICASGLPALVMSQLPLIYDPNKIYFPYPEIFSNICLIIIFGTVLYGSIATSIIIGRKLQVTPQID